MPAGWLVDDARYQAFIPRGTHEACIWGHKPDALLDPTCRQVEEMEFYQASGLHYVPGEGRDGEIPVAAVTPCTGGCPAGETCIQESCRGVRYGFRSLAAELWTRAHEYSSLGEQIWSKFFEYQPGPEQARRPGGGINLPLSFTGSLADSPGQPPWAWDDVDDSQVERGQWFIDPAYSIGRHLKPMEGDPWSLELGEYCWNVYLGIFERDQVGCSGNP
jgi:hypothetical protein